LNQQAFKENVKFVVKRELVIEYSIKSLVLRILDSPTLNFKNYSNKINFNNKGMSLPCVPK